MAEKTLRQRAARATDAAGEEVRRRFGEQLRRLRQAQGSKQEELAARVGITRFAMSRYEQGKNSPPLTTLIALATALECGLDDLVPRDTGSSPRERSRKLRRLVRQAQRLPQSQREALVVILRALVLRVDRAADDSSQQEDRSPV